MSNKAPANWKEKNFEQAMKKVTYTNKILKKDFMTTGVFPIISQEEEYISGYWNDKKDVYKINKPVVIFGDHTKVIKYVNFDFVLGADGVKIFETIDEILPKYLYYYLKNTQLRNLGYARHYKLLKEKYIMYPPLSEQERIVRILDKAFENIEKAKQNTLQNLNNAKELFESHLKTFFEKSNSDWREYRLIDITSKIGSGSTPLGGKKSYTNEGISLIRSMNVHDRQFVHEGLAHINEQQANELNGVTIYENDVLLNITGASVARCCVVPNDVIPARVNQHVSIIRPRLEYVSAKFLCYLLTSKYYKDRLLKEGEEGGATRQALTKSGLEQFVISIPEDLNMQEKIVGQLEKIHEYTQKLEQTYNQKLKSLEELKQSILQKAFNGEL